MKPFLEWYSVVIFSLMAFLLSGCRVSSFNSEEFHRVSGHSPLKKTEPRQYARASFISQCEIVSDDPLEDANSIYEGNENIPQGVYVYQGLVLIVVEVRLDQEYDIEPEGIAMLRENHLLRSHYHLPENFSIDRNLLENREDDDGIFYRYVTVYRLKDIQKLLQKDM